MWPIGLIMKWSLLKHVFSILSSRPGAHIKLLSGKVYTGNSGEWDCTEWFNCTVICLQPLNTEAWKHFFIFTFICLFLICSPLLSKPEAVESNSFFSVLNVLSWGLKCWCEIFLLILSVSPHHAVPQGWGISSEKRKPLPHYAANFRHQEKMFGNSWPRFQMLEWYPLYSHGWSRGDFGTWASSK